MFSFVLLLFYVCVLFVFVLLIVVCYVCVLSCVFVSFNFRLMALSPFQIL